jgi:hypothetical protein
MRRVLSTVLTVVALLPLLATLLATGSTVQLPMCCRRAGVHHCMQMAGPETSGIAVRAVCPAFPRQQSSVHTEAWSISAASTASVAWLQQPTILGQVEAGYRIASLRSRQKRGPPSLEI